MSRTTTVWVSQRLRYVLTEEAEELFVSLMEVVAEEGFERDGVQMIDLDLDGCVEVCRGRKDIWLAFVEAGWIRFEGEFLIVTASAPARFT